MTPVVYQDIPGFPGYRVGIDGTVWSCWKGGGKHARRIMVDKWKLLKPTPMKSGHLHLNISTPDGKRIYVLVHHLVLQAWHGFCPEGLEARHLNDNPTDNQLSNLRWGTRTQNIDDRKKNGSWICGSASSNAKITDDQVREILRRCVNGEKQRVVAADYGIHQSEVSRIVRAKRWAHMT